MKAFFPILVVLFLVALTNACGSSKSGGRSQLQAIIPPNSLEPIEKAIGTPLYEASRSVARADLDGYCTSIRISRDLFMTNQHCFLDTTCQRTTFTLAYENDISAENRPVFQCEEVLLTHFMLDYSIARVSETTNLDSLQKYPPAILSAKLPEEGLQLFAPGHPRGRLMEMDRSDQCKITEMSFDQIYHTCDNELGSSGSPLFDRATLHVIGINWGEAPQINAGTAMSAILEDIQQNKPELYKELRVSSN